MTFTKKDIFERAKAIADTQNLKVEHTFQVLKLLSEDNTIPFIARYRKELTGSMEDEQIRLIVKQDEYLVAMDDKRQTIFNTLEKLDIEDEQLTNDILMATSLTQLEDLYRPYKPKKKTKAMLAVELGCQPLADAISQKQPDAIIQKLISQLLQSQPQLTSADECLQRAIDILVAKANDDAKLREQLRKVLTQSGVLQTQVKEAIDHTFESYYHFSQALKKLRSHQILAINRGEAKNALKVALLYDEARVDFILSRYYRITEQTGLAMYCLVKAKQLAFSQYLFPALVKEIRNQLTQVASDEAIMVFSKNLKQALLTAPLKNQTILALDPGYKNGCKWAVVNPYGDPVDWGVLYLFTQKATSIKQFKTILKQHPIQLIAVGNGTAGRETIDFVTAHQKTIPLTIVDESGASIYSATPLAAKELGHIPLNNRSAVSLARRMLDPLAELVKIDAKSIGVGQYQHDMNEKQLHQSLYGVVEDCVNQVGVTLNTASASLLSYVAGLNQKLAEKIIAYKEANGPFYSRGQLLKVAGLGLKTYEQCVGFLRIVNGENPLDATSIHPESYPIAQAILDAYHLKIGEHFTLDDKQAQYFSAQYNVGLETLQDIVVALNQPLKDIREDFAAPKIIQEITSIHDLKVNQIMEGVVRNVTTFGAFVDLGLHQDGLIHISQMAKRFVSNPSEIVAVGQTVVVKVIEIDLQKERIGLSLKDIE